MFIIRNRNSTITEGVKYNFRAYKVFIIIFISMADVSFQTRNLRIVKKVVWQARKLERLVLVLPTPALEFFVFIVGGSLI
jgi:hypothetical protein